jgi:hypothetical protein
VLGNAFEKVSIRVKYPDDANDGNENRKANEKRNRELAGQRQFELLATEPKKATEVSPQNPKWMQRVFD